MQIVQKMPPKNKIMALSELMIPRVQPILDQGTGKQYLIMQQE